jgi:hypothetical protein
MAVARREGALVMVHAENHDCVAWQTDQLIAAGRTAPKYHAASRPMAVEREATHRAISLAEVADVPVFLVHVSAREAAEQIAWARERGLAVYGETCPQYLVLDETDLDRPGFEGAKLTAPPLNGKPGEPTADSPSCSRTSSNGERRDSSATPPRRAISVSGPCVRSVTYGSATRTSNRSRSPAAALSSHIPHGKPPSVRNRRAADAQCGSSVTLGVGKTLILFRRRTAGADFRATV